MVMLPPGTVIEVTGVITGGAFLQAVTVAVIGIRGLSHVPSLMET
jgi:hypothetical protein